MNLMIVDDSEIVRVILRHLLTQVASATLTGEFDDVHTAVAGIRENPPDALLLDVQLRTGTGLDVLKAVTENHPKIKVFVVTNFTDEIYYTRYLAAGASGFFDKSRQLGSLRTQLQQLSCHFENTNHCLDAAPVHN